MLRVVMICQLKAARREIPPHHPPARPGAPHLPPTTYHPPFRHLMTTIWCEKYGKAFWLENYTWVLLGNCYEGQVFYFSEQRTSLWERKTCLAGLHFQSKYFSLAFSTFRQQKNTQTKGMEETLVFTHIQKLPPFLLAHLTSVDDL